jgi:hypothetical protein
MNPLWNRPKEDDRVSRKKIRQKQYQVRHRKQINILTKGWNQLINNKISKENQQQ